MSNPLAKPLRKLWRRYGSLVPVPVRDRLVEFRRQRQRRAIEALSGGVYPVQEQVIDSHVEALLAQAKKQKRTRGDRSGSITQPHLAFDYLSGLVRWLADSEYTVMSYENLAPLKRHGLEEEEFRAWSEAALARREKAVLLQYDVDAHPDVTMALLETHIDCGVPANVMVFREKIFDWKLKKNGELERDDSYVLDFELIERFQRMGGVVGYHCNAFDRAAGDMDRAVEIFHDDVAYLRQHIDLKYFSMHGGLVTETGDCNATLRIQPSLDKLGMTWVHNGHSIQFHRKWADGSASNPRYRLESNDPLDFILGTNAGERCRLLFHPQYYKDFDNRQFDFPVLADQRWVAETRDAVETGAFDGQAFWQERVDRTRRRVSSYRALFQAEETAPPVFVHGMSRSGTTLLVSIIDAHPDAAMAYESYPRYLYVPADEGVLTAEDYVYAAQVLINNTEEIAFELLNRSPFKNLMRFVAVSTWTGMNTREIGELLHSFLMDHRTVANAREALAVVAATARFKIRNESARFWGSKCQGNFDDYLAVWPDAHFLYIVRHGLDILASQKTTGAFNPEPKRLGESWKRQYEQFVKFSRSRPELSAHVVKYEDLVTEPEETVRGLCADIGLNFDSRMIRQHEETSTLTANPRGQLSAERVQQPIDTSAIGRWQFTLSQEEVDAFLSGCGGQQTFHALGYYVD